MLTSDSRSPQENQQQLAWPFLSICVTVQALLPPEMSFWSGGVSTEENMG